LPTALLNLNLNYYKVDINILSDVDLANIVIFDYLQSLLNVENMVSS